MRKALSIVWGVWRNGTDFDPNVHEAVIHEPSDAHREGEVMQELQRGYMLGDRLLPESVDIPLNFFPKAPDSQIDGSIISVVDGVSLIGQYHVVVMNRGARDGLAPGDVLTVFQQGEVVTDRFADGSMWGGGEKVKLPDEEAGTVMVFKVYDRIAYGLVMEATSDIHVYDAVRNPT